MGGRHDGRTFGLVLIFATAIIWVISSFISQSLVQPGAGHEQAVPPFLLTYLATSLFTLYLPFVYGRLMVIDLWRNWNLRREQEGSPSERAPLQQAAEQQAEELAEHNRQAHKQAFNAALWATPLWFFAQYAFNASLALTSVTSNTILSSTSSLFTFAMAVLLLGERFTARKLACIFMCILGTALFTFADTERSGNAAGARSLSNAHTHALHGSGLEGVTSLSAGWWPSASLDAHTSSSWSRWDVGSGSAGDTGSRRRAAAAGELVMGPDRGAAGVAALWPSHLQQGLKRAVHRGAAANGGLLAGGRSMLAHAALSKPFVRPGSQPARGTAEGGGLGATREGGRGVLSSSGGSSRGGGGSGAMMMQQGGRGQAKGPEPAPDPLLGDFLVLVSSALYGAYTVVIRLKMPGEEAEANVALFFGYVGLLTTVALAPVVLVMVASSTVSLSAIPRQVYLIILLEGLLDYVLSDYLWARAVLLIGPTVATLGLSIQIPIAAVAELLVGTDKIQWLSSSSSIFLALVGTASILVGFVGINLIALASPAPQLPTEGEDDVAEPGTLAAAGEGHHHRKSSTGGSMENELGSLRNAGGVDRHNGHSWQDGGDWDSDGDTDGGGGSIGGIRHPPRAPVKKLRGDAPIGKGKAGRSKSGLGATRAGRVSHRDANADIEQGPGPTAMAASRLD